MCEHGTEECPELTVCDGCLKDAKIKRAMDKKEDDRDIGNEEGSGIPSTTVTRPNFLEGWTMPDGAHCTSCRKFTTNRVVCTHCGAAQKEDAGVGTIGGTEASLLKENAALRTRVSMLELALDEIYCSVRRAKPAPECPTGCKAVLHDELYARNIELLNIAVRNHNDKVSALQEAQNLNDRNKQLEFECKRECERLEAIIAKGNAENVRFRNIIAESDIKPHVTGQGLPREGS